MTATNPRRIWAPGDLAKFFGYGIDWVYHLRYTDDPPPRCAGLRRLKFDTESPEFQAWLERQLRQVDNRAHGRYTLPGRKTKREHHRKEL